MSQYITTYFICSKCQKTYQFSLVNNISGMRQYQCKHYILKCIKNFDNNILMYNITIQCRKCNKKQGKQFMVSNSFNNNDLYSNQFNCCDNVINLTSYYSKDNNETINNVEAIGNNIGMNNITSNYMNNKIPINNMQNNNMMGMNMAGNQNMMNNNNPNNNLNRFNSMDNSNMNNMNAMGNMGNAGNMNDGFNRQWSGNINQNMNNNFNNIFPNNMNNMNNNNSFNQNFNNNNNNTFNRMSQNQNMMMSANAQMSNFNMNQNNNAMFNNNNNRQFNQMNNNMNFNNNNNNNINNNGQNADDEMYFYLNKKHAKLGDIVNFFFEFNSQRYPVTKSNTIMFNDCFIEFLMLHPDIAASVNNNTKLIHGGSVINKNQTLFENKIKDKSVIIIQYLGQM